MRLTPTRSTTGFNLLLKSFPLRQPWLNLTMRWKVLVPMFSAGSCLAVTAILLSGGTTADRADQAALAAGRLLVAQATREIADKIQAIQADSAAVVDAIGGISMVIMRIHDLHNTIAASVEEQSAATAEIDRSAAQAARDTTAIAAQVTTLAFSAGQATAQAQSAEDAARALAQMAGDQQALIERFRLS